MFLNNRYLLSSSIITNTHVKRVLFKQLRQQQQQSGSLEVLLTNNNKEFINKVSPYYHNPSSYSFQYSTSFSLNKTSFSSGLFQQHYQSGLKRMSYCTLSKEDLSKKKCQPCEGGIPKLTNPQSEELLKKLNENWKIIYQDNDAYMLTRKWRIPFPKGLELMNQVGVIAEEENHHPDMSIKSYWDLVIDIYTHTIKGLSENDFILASKIDNLELSKYQPKRRTKENSDQ